MNEDDGIVCGQGAGFLKRTFGAVEVEEGRFETGRVEGWECAEGMQPFLPVKENRDILKVGQAADMIEVEMGEEDGIRGQLVIGELLMDLFVGADVEPELGVKIAPDEGAGEVVGVIDPGAEAGIYEEDPFGVLDNGDPDGQPFGEAGVEDRVEEREPVMEPGLAEPGLVGAFPGGEEVHAEGAAADGPFGCYGWEKCGHAIVIWCNL